MARGSPFTRRRGDRPLDVPSHRSPGRVAERDRRSREADLVAVVCAGCGAELATVLPGAECYCPQCHRWSSSLTQGVVIA